MTIYGPSEDTWMLEDSLRLLGEAGLAIEVGCGSGYIAKVLSRTCREVIAIDIEPEALSHARETIASSVNVHLVCSDCLRCIRSGAPVDLIASNPPYLPDEEEVHDPAIHGGPSGTETALKILEQSRSYIKQGGTALIVASSLGDLRRIERWAEDNMLSISITVRRRLFFEELVVMKIQRDIASPKNFGEARDDLGLPRPHDHLVLEADPPNRR